MCYSSNPEFFLFNISIIKKESKSRVFKHTRTHIIKSKIEIIQLITMSCSICNEIYYKWEISILLVVLSADLLLLRLQYTLVNVQTKPQYSPNITISLLSSVLRNHYEKLFLLVLCHLPLPRIYLVPMERTCITSHLPRSYLLPRGAHVYHITSPSYLSTPSWNARVSHHISHQFWEKF